MPPRRPSDAGPPSPARVGRPPLPEAERLGQTIGVRLSPADHEAIAARAKRANLTAAEYMRRRAIRAPLPIVVPEVNRAAWVELGKLAGNLNQLVRRLNLGQIAVVQPADAATIVRVEVQVQALRRALVGQPEAGPDPSPADMTGSSPEARP